MKVDAVLYFKVIDPERAIIKVHAGRWRFLGARPTG
jgi:hypothetical protein